MRYLPKLQNFALGESAFLTSLNLRVGIGRVEEKRELILPTLRGFCFCYEMN